MSLLFSHNRQIRETQSDTNDQTISFRDYNNCRIFLMLKFYIFHRPPPPPRRLFDYVTPRGERTRDRKIRKDVQTRTNRVSPHVSKHFANFPRVMTPKCHAAATEAQKRKNRLWHVHWREPPLWRFDRVAAIHGALWDFRRENLSTSEIP